MNIPAALKQYRLKNKLLQKDMAKLIGITTRHYQKLETGYCQPGIKSGFKIALLLNLKNKNDARNETADNV